MATKGKKTLWSQPMFHFLHIVSVLLALTSYGVTAKTATLNNQLMSMEQGISLLTSTTGKITFKNDQFQLLDRKEIFILWSMGKKDTETTKDEYKRLWSFINKASSEGYEVTVNTHAMVSDYIEAIEGMDTHLLIISAHGNDEGFYDYYEELVPYSAFENASSSLSQVILGACYGREMLPLYNVPKRIKVHSWEGSVYTDDVFNLIYSVEWQKTILSLE